MYILFIDESGTPKINTGKKYFVLCGLLIDSNNWIEINKGLCKIKSDYPMKRPDGEIKWRYFVPKNRDKDNPIPVDNRELCNSLRNSVYNFLLTDKIEKIIYTAIDLQNEKYHGENVERGLIHKDAYALLFNEFYSTINKLNYKDAMIICDNLTDERDNTIHQLIRDHHIKINKNYTNLPKKVTDDLFIVDSKYSTGIQLVDMAAGAIGHKYNNPDDNKLNYYEKIKEKLTPIESCLHSDYYYEEDAELEQE